MKFLIFSSCLLYACSLSAAVYTKQQIAQLGVVCNATKEDLEVAQQYKVPSTETGKSKIVFEIQGAGGAVTVMHKIYQVICLMYCMVDKLGMLSKETGEYSLNGTLVAVKTYWSEYSDAQLEEIALKCQSAVSTYDSTKYRTCDYGYLVIKCINEEFSKKNLLKVVEKEVAKPV